MITYIGSIFNNQIQVKSLNVVTAKKNRKSTILKWINSHKSLTHNNCKASDKNSHALLVYACFTWWMSRHKFGYVFCLFWSLTIVWLYISYDMGDGSLLSAKFKHDPMGTSTTFTFTSSVIILKVFSLSLIFSWATDYKNSDEIYRSQFAISGTWELKSNPSSV